MVVRGRQSEALNMREKRIGKKENEVKLVQKADEVNGDWLY